MSILLFAFFMLVYAYLFIDTRPTPDQALTAPAAPIRAAAKAAPTPTITIKQPAVKATPAPIAVVEAPVASALVEDAKPTKLVPLRKWATRHGIKGAARMNLATLGKAIERAGL